MAKKFSIGKARTVTMEAPTAPKNPVGRPRKPKAVVEVRHPIGDEPMVKRGRSSKVETVVEVPVAVTRGRPRKPKIAVTAETAQQSVTANGTQVTPVTQRQKRISNQQLLQADVESGRIPLAAQKMIDQFEALIGRADVQEFRGRKVKPQITISTMEHQALQEAMTLFGEKLTLQRGGQLRRVSSK